AGTPAEQPLFGEPGSPLETMWARSIIRALCAADADIAELVGAAAAQAGLKAPQYRTETVPDEDWVRLTQAQFDPIRVSQRLWIVPSWHEPPDADAITLRLDPGLAFGTGSHPTTRLCLRWLETHLHGGEHVLDYGCGSGILAIAALKLGAGQATGVDIDREAVAQARVNAHNNDVIAQFIDTQKPLSLQADLVVANILAIPLKVLAPLLASHCRSGGRIALAGLLDEQADDVAAAYAPWFDMAVYASAEGWTALEGERR
ncbi:MAG TPA: 50S ribosomal protein L11 methyltransferase, partial [Burkholderiales bacterium]